MKVLTAIDSFKGSITSQEINQGIIQFLLEKKLIAEGIALPIADGGEGTATAIFHSCGGTWQTVDTVDLLFRKRQARFLVTTIQQRKVAVVESAEVVALDFIDPSPTTIRQGSTYGLGKVLKAALQAGVDEIVLTLGGSGTVDGGLGLLQALGAKVFDQEGWVASLGVNPLLVGETFDFSGLTPAFSEVKLFLAADVKNPYYGHEGAAAVFGPQKGADSQQVEELDNQLKKVAQSLIQQVGVDVQNFPGSGAAGGLGGSLLAIGAEMVSGFDFVSQGIGLAEKIATVDLVITGEGRLDSQSLQGKVPFGVAQIAKSYGKPVVALCGSCSEELGELEQWLTAVFSIQLQPVSLAEAMETERALHQAQLVASNVVKLFQAR